MCLQAEDRVDELCKDLAQTRHRLEATEEVMRHKEEETAMVRTRTLHFSFSFLLILILSSVHDLGGTWGIE